MAKLLSLILLPFLKYTTYIRDKSIANAF